MSDILILIPKYETYMDYELSVISKIPKLAKYSIGNEFKNSILEVLKNIYLLGKVGRSYRLDICNQIDANISYQRSLLRLMYKERYITEKNLLESMRMLKELGMLLGGYIKYLGVKYAKED